MKMQSLFRNTGKTKEVYYSSLFLPFFFFFEHRYLLCGSCLFNEALYVCILHAVSDLLFPVTAENPAVLEIVCGVGRWAFVGADSALERCPVNSGWWGMVGGWDSEQKLNRKRFGEDRR